MFAKDEKGLNMNISLALLDSGHSFPGTFAGSLEAGWLN